jgi:hypothetical protein
MEITGRRTVAKGTVARGPGLVLELIERVGGARSEALGHTRARPERREPGYGKAEFSFE